MRLENKVALVTGAGSGIGKAIALAFAKEGAKVAANDVTLEKVKTTVAEIGKLGGEGLGVAADVSRVPEVKDMFSKVLARFGTLDILVNNAGIAVLTDEVLKRNDMAIEQLMTTGSVKISLEATRYMTDEAWDRMLAVPLYGTFYCTREALNTMEDKGYGKIVNIASIAGMVGLPGSPDYSAAKGAIIAFTKSVAKEVIPVGVYVNAICPGWIDTPLLNILTPTMRAGAIAATPLGRMGTPEEVAAVAVFLASDESSFVVGQAIVPGGGGYV